MGSAFPPYASPIPNILCYQGNSAWLWLAPLRGFPQAICLEECLWGRQFVASLLSMLP